MTKRAKVIETQHAGHILKHAVKPLPSIAELRGKAAEMVTQTRFLLTFKPVIAGMEDELKDSLEYASMLGNSFELTDEGLHASFYENHTFSITDLFITRSIYFIVDVAVYNSQGEGRTISRERYQPPVLKYCRGMPEGTKPDPLILHLLFPKRVY